MLNVRKQTEGAAGGNLHVSGSEVHVPLELLAQRLDDGQADALVAACYHGNPWGHA